jgi:Zn-dependent protease/CBS domain-containing protein
MNALKIGKIAGIDIRIHWSWLIIFTLLVWWLAEGFFGGINAYDHWTATQRWAASVTATLLFFTSILLHELSHSLVAKRLKLPVSSITLFIFGGVSALEEEPRTAGHEFLIAIVGPLTSFIIGGLFAIATVIAYANDAQNNVPGAVVQYLAFINIAVGIFNMLPGYPLDGGRVLRSALWSRTKNVVKATRWASHAGTFISFGLIAIGVLSILAGSFIGGAWFIIIGWFLRNTSEAAYQQVLFKNTLEGAKVSEMLNRTFHSAPPDISLTELVNEHMLRHSQRCVPIVVGGDLLGLVTMNDLQKFPHEEWPTTSAFKAMTPQEKLHVVSVDDDLTQALELMARHDVHQVPVMDHRDFLGFVTRADVLRLIQLRSQMAGAGSN